MIVPLEIKYDDHGRKNSIFPVIAYDEYDMILIDCGFPDFLNLVEKEANRQGLDFNRLTKIIITHQDFDHFGSLAAFKRKYPAVEILSSSIDAEYINGNKKLLRLVLSKDTLSKEEKARMQRIELVEKVKVDRSLEDKEVLNCCGGVEIISTPGHLPGHICVYFKENKTLVAGDALSIENGELANANPIFTLDMNQARKSIKKLLHYDIETIMTYHFGVYKGNIKKAINMI
ncbi:MAG: MBL fold metallo-hydrolase [Eubacteriales bacterium]